MCKLRVFLAALLLCVAFFSAQAETVGVKSNVNGSAVIAFSIFSDLTEVTSVNQTTAYIQQQETHQPDHTTQQPKLISNNSSLFFYSEQTEPQYELIFEIFAQTLATQASLQSKAVNTPQPWYTLVSNSKKSRLSGWKDANLLYKAVTTYHA